MLHRENLMSFAVSIVMNEEDAQDVVQEVFQQCLEQPRDQYTRSFLFQAVRNRSLTKIRSKNRYLLALEKFAEFLKDSLMDSSDHEFSIDAALAKLPATQRDVLVLRIKAELKISEISNVLNIPEGTVKSRINQAMGSLKKQLKGISNESV